MPAGETYEVTVVWAGGGSFWANVLYCNIVDDTGTTDAELDLQQAVKNQVIDKVLDLLSFQVSTDCYLIRRKLPTTAPSRVFVDSSSGTIINPMLPANQALVMSHRSKPPRRENIGHVFWSGTTEAWAVNGRFNGAGASVFTPIITAFTADIVDGGRTYRMKHFSRALGAFADISTVAFRPIYTKLRNRTKKLCPIS